MLDSLLYTLADELVPDAACATFATASEGDGVIVGKICDEEKTKGWLGGRGNWQRRAIGRPNSEKSELQSKIVSEPTKKSSSGKRVVRVQSPVSPRQAPLVSGIPGVPYLLHADRNKCGAG